MDKELSNNFLTGFWKADSNYCNEAEIDDMVLYINSNTDTGHLIITKNNELIENSNFDIEKTISTNLIPFNNVLGNQYMEYKIKFHSNDETFCWDDTFTLILSIINGTIILYKNDVLYSKLYKDNTISNKFIDYAKLEEN